MAIWLRRSEDISGVIHHSDHGVQCWPSAGPSAWLRHYAAGYAVDEIEPPAIAEAAEVWANVLIPEVRAMWPMMLSIISDDANRVMGLVFDANPEVDVAGHMQAMMARQSLARKWAEFQLGHPLILAPVCTEPPFAVGTDLTPEGVAGIVRSMRMVVAVNLLGLPAATVPVGMAEGLPQEVQVIGPRYREDLCLDAAEPWRWPSGL